MSPPVADPPVAGVDGARGAWLTAVLDGSSIDLARCRTFDEVVDLADERELAVVGVDMPMGLPDTGGRAADREARALLGPRRSTLFPTPVAAVLDAADHADACRRSLAVSGRKLSIQAFNLVPMIRQLRGAVPAQASDRFVEVHPETSFVELAGEPLAPKRTATGIAQRLAVLSAALGAGLEADLDEVVATAPSGVAVDDVLDALVVAWSARRHATGTARIFGAGAGVDTAGYPLRIIA